MDKNRLLCSVACIKFAVKSKLKNIIRLEKSIAMNPKIDIQLVNAKNFFHIAQKKRYKSFL